MNGSPPGLYVPAWAERELAKKDAFDQARFETLERFYKAWEAFHAIPPDKINRKKKEEAAQAMVDQAHILRRMYAEREPPH
jgi:hypothetical protein